MNDVKDKRQHERTAVRMLFTVSHESFGSMTFPCRDFSAGGLYIYNDAGVTVPPKGSIVDVRIAGPGGVDDVVQAEIRYIENDGEGFGVKFLNLEDEKA